MSFQDKWITNGAEYIVKLANEGKISGEMASRIIESLPNYRAGTISGIYKPSAKPIAKDFEGFKDLSFPVRNAVRDELYDSFLRTRELARDYGYPALYGAKAAMTAAAPVATMASLPIAAAMSGAKSYYDYNTMPRDQFHDEKLNAMPED